MSHWKSQLTNYHGSTVLQPYAEAIGVQVDKFNLLIAGLCSVGLGYLYSYLLPVRRVPVAMRKFTLIVLGLAVLYFCFGRDVCHVIAEATLAYVLMLAVSVDRLPLVTLVVSLGYQSLCHVWRQYSDPDGYTVDITGAIMMLTQRVTTLAFSLRDGMQPGKVRLTAEQIRDAVHKRPDMLSYFAYMLDFHEIFAGPLISYNEFLRIAEGRNIPLRRSKNEDSLDLVHPSPHWEVARKLFYVALNCVLVLKVVPLLTEQELLSDWFRNQSFFSKILYLNAFSFLSRVQYYLVWKLAEAVCNSSGYGYYVTAKEATLPAGESDSVQTSSKHGVQGHWDGADNIRIIRLETAPSLKVVLDNWNVSTQRWLRHVCYDREVKSKTAMTFFLSALWHGFYPGYFLAFMTCSLFVSASRVVRRSVRPRALALLGGGANAQRMYDAVTFMFSASFLAYTTAPFVLLQLSKAVQLWRSVYFFGHVLALAAFGIPYVLPPPRSSARSCSPSTVASSVSKAAFEKNGNVKRQSALVALSVQPELKKNGEPVKFNGAASAAAAAAVNIGSNSVGSVNEMLIGQMTFVKGQEGILTNGKAH